MSCALLTRGLLLAAFCVLSLHAPAQTPPTEPGEGAAYDEVFAGDVIRPHYAPLLSPRRTSPLERDLEMLALEDSVQGDYPVAIMPAVLPFDESAFMRQAVAQRARAMRAIADDLFSPRPSERLRAIPPEVLRRALERGGLEGLVERMRSAPESVRKQMRFFYAPDLIRSASGAFWFMEDNVSGMIGGLGDHGPLAAAVLRRTDGPGAIAPVDPFSFLRNSVASMRSESGSGIVVAIQSHTKLDDQEDDRLNDLLRAEGVVVLRPDEFRRIRRCSDRSLCLMRADGAETTIGYIANFYSELLADVHSADGFDVFARTLARDELRRPVRPGALDSVRNAMRDALARPNIDARALWAGVRALDSGASSFLANRPQIRGLNDAWLAGRVRMNNTLAIGFLDDKELAPWIDRAIRVYLGESPLIESIPTMSLAGLEQASDEELNRIAEAGWSRLVLKEAVSRAGRGVIIGRDLGSADAFAQVLLRIKRRAGEAAHWISQPFVAPSIIGNHALNYRLFAYVDGAGDVQVSEVGYVRSAVAGGNRVGERTDRRINLSLGGAAVRPLFAARAPLSCPRSVGAE